MTGKME